MNESFKGQMAVFIAALLWGTTGTVAHFAPEPSAFTIGAVAMGGGGLLQAWWAKRFIWQAHQQIWAQKRFWLLGAVAVFVYPLSFYGSMRLAGITLGTVLTIGAAPMFSLLLEKVWEQRIITQHEKQGIALSILGIGIFNLPMFSQTHGLQSQSTLVGIILGIVAAFTYALYSWTTRRMMRHPMPAPAAMGATFGLGAVLLLPIILCTDKALWLHAQNLTVALYMAVVPMFLGYLAFGYGLARIVSSHAITITLCEPVVAAFLAMHFANEPIMATSWLGMAVLLFGIYRTTQAKAL